MELSFVEESQKLYAEETEIKPNRYAANVLGGVVFVITFAFAFNEIGIFQLDKRLVRICFLATIALFFVVQSIVYSPRRLKHPASKYIIMVIVLLFILTVTAFLNIHAVLAFVLPILLATQYRSYRLSFVALAGSCVCCAAAPVLSYLLGTWSVSFMTGFFETFCSVYVTTLPGNDQPLSEAIQRIMLYWSLPQMLTLCAFGLILFSVTRSGINNVDNQLRIADMSRDLNRQLQSILSMQEKVLYSMSDIIESRDIDTGDHVRRTSEVVRMLTNAMRADPASGVTNQFCENIVKAAPMHDLGKISINDAILRKPGRLTPEEFRAVQQHPIMSEEIIGRVLTGIEDDDLLRTARNLARCHHERVDGTGYPDRLKGKEIPLEARIMAIADVYDALVSERCYKAPMSFGEAFETIEGSMGTQFDPDLNPYFLACREEIERYYQS